MRTSGVAGAVSAIEGSVSGSTCVAKRLLQQIESAVELLVGDRERHEDADHVAVDPAGEENEAALACNRSDTGSEVGRLLRELEREHRAEPAHLPGQVALSHKVSSCSGAFGSGHIGTLRLRTARGSHKVSSCSGAFGSGHIGTLRLRTARGSHKVLEVR